MLTSLIAFTLLLPLAPPPPPPLSSSPPAFPPPPLSASALGSPRYADREAASEEFRRAIRSARARGRDAWPPACVADLTLAHESGDLETRVRAHELLRLAHAIRPRCLQCQTWAAGASCFHCAERDGMPAVGGRGALVCRTCRRREAGQPCRHCNGTGRCTTCPSLDGSPALDGRGPIDCRECGGSGRTAR